MLIFDVFGLIPKASIFNVIGMPQMMSASLGCRRIDIIICRLDDIMQVNNLRNYILTSTHFFSSRRLVELFMSLSLHERNLFLFFVLMSRKAFRLSSIIRFIIFLNRLGKINQILLIIFYSLLFIYILLATVSLYFFTSLKVFLILSSFHGGWRVTCIIISLIL
jgi:hypothetical protein